MLWMLNASIYYGWISQFSWVCTSMFINSCLQWGPDPIKWTNHSLSPSSQHKSKPLVIVTRLKSEYRPICLVMAHVLRPLMQFPPRLHHRYGCTAGAFYHFLTSSDSLPPSSETTKIHLHRQLLRINFSFFLSTRNLHRRTRALKSRQVHLPSDAATTESDSDSSSDGSAKKSRNEKKREAKRAVRWGMELANFSPPQIKRILRCISVITLPLSFITLKFDKL